MAPRSLRSLRGAAARSPANGPGATQRITGCRRAAGAGSARVERVRALLDEPAR